MDNKKPSNAESDWIKIDSERPPSLALVVFYVPFGRYIWSCGSDYDQIKAEYPAATHWKVISYEPQ